MKLGNRKAIHRFPGLLQIIERFPQHSNLFIENVRFSINYLLNLSKKILSQQSADIPCWMYLSWLGQMTALLDKQISCIVHQPLLNVASTYPNVLIVIIFYYFS